MIWFFLKSLELQEGLTAVIYAKTMDHVTDANLLYPREFLLSVDLSNFPQHKICLKVSVPVICKKHQSIGLCNRILQSHKL
jgi:hypothetical protein